MNIPDAPWIENYEEYRDAYYGIEDERDEYYDDDDLEFELAREERIYG